MVCPACHMVLCHIIALKVTVCKLMHFTIKQYYQNTTRAYTLYTDITRCHFVILHGFDFDSSKAEPRHDHVVFSVGTVVFLASLLIPALCEESPAHSWRPNIWLSSAGRDTPQAPTKAMEQEIPPVVVLISAISANEAKFQLIDSQHRLLQIPIATTENSKEMSHEDLAGLPDWLDDSSAPLRIGARAKKTPFFLKGLLKVVFSSSWFCRPY